MDRALAEITTIVTAIIGVAILAVLVSKNANTSGVISSASQGLSGLLGTALSPVTGSNSNSFSGLNSFNVF